MIKIIEYGTRKTTNCNMCGCVFSYEKEDERDDARRYEKFVICPQCGMKVTVNTRAQGIQFPTFD